MYIVSDSRAHQNTVVLAGTFSEYLVADAELQVVPIPIGWSSKNRRRSAAGVAPLTALQSLHESLDLPSPFEAR